MGSSGVVPALEPAKKEFSWKRLFIKAAGFGAGATLMLMLLGGVSFWWLNRPKPPKSWDVNAIKGGFYSVHKGGDEKMEFLYVLENTTNSDFHLEDDSNVKMTALLEDSGSLLGASEVKLEYPIFIPSKHKARIKITMPSYGFKDKLPENATSAQRHELEVKLARFLTSHLSNLNGFTIFDEQDRYEIALLNGWKKIGEEKLPNESPTK